MPRIVAIIQARMSSERLPGKVLMDLAGEPMLAHVVRRAQATKALSEVVVATAEATADDVIAALCRGEGWQCFRGSEADVLDRYYRCAKQHGAEQIVRITADNPLTCPEQAARAIEHHLITRAEYTHMEGLPLGTAVEVIEAGALERAWREGIQPHHREHVTPYLYEVSGRCRAEKPAAPRELAHPEMRLTVDVAEDLDLMRRIYAALYEPGRLVRLPDVVDLLRTRPELLAINRHVEQRSR